MTVSGTFASILGVLVAFAGLLLSPVLAAIALRRVGALRDALNRTDSRLDSLEARLAAEPSAESAHPRPYSTDDESGKEAATSAPAHRESLPQAETAKSDPAEWGAGADAAQGWGSNPRATATPAEAGDATGGIERTLTSRWMVWLGGVTVALAGVFLVKYSIDQNWLGPSMRCALGVLVGVALSVAGEWLRRRPLQRAMETVEPGAIPAALSAAGIATLYSSVYAAFALYDLIGALLAFVALAAVSFVCFALALLHGRFIAVLGLIGGYLVPALVSTGGGSAPALFSFLLALAGALTVLVRYRGWWEAAWLGLAGATIWPVLWFSTQWHPTDAPVLGVYLVALAALFLYVRPVVGTERRFKLEILLRQADAFLWVSAVAISTLIFALVRVDGYAPVSLTVLAVASGLFLHAGYRAERYDLLGALALVLVLASFATWDIPRLLDSAGRALGEHGWLYDLGRGPVVPPLLVPYASLNVAFAALFGIAGLLALWRARRPWVWAAVSAAAPVSLLAIEFWRVQEFDIDLNWAVAALIVAGLLLRCAAQVAPNRDRPGMAGALAAYAMGVVAALSLAMAMSLEQAWLTVALSLQIPAIAAIHDRLPLAGLRRVAWIVAGVVLSRLVLNHQILDYTVGVLPGFGWTVYGYGIPCVGFWYAARRYRSHGDASLARFHETGALAFGVLAMSLQIRFWTAGDIGATTYSFLERSLQTVAWLAIAYGLYLRSDGSRRDVYDWGWRLLGGAAVLQLVLLQILFAGPLARPIVVGNHAVANLMLLAYGLPALFAVLFLVVARSRPSDDDRRVATIAGVMLLVLVFVEATLEVRRAFHGSMLVSGFVDGEFREVAETSNAEWYAYSVAWLAYAGVLLALGIRWTSSALRYASLALIMLTTVKLFVFDMSELTGLFRVVSFLGLGLSLIGVGFLYQRYVFPRRTPKPTTTP